MTRPAAPSSTAAGLHLTATRLAYPASPGGRLAEAGGPGQGEWPRRVALFTETFLPRVDGIVNTLCWVLRGLVDSGREPLVVAPAGNTAEFPGARVIGVSSTSLPLYPEVRLGLLGPGIWRTLDAFKPDLVHLVGPVVNGVGGLVYARARGLPVVASYHTDLPRYTRHYAIGWLEPGVWTAMRALHNACDLTLCPSHAVVDDLSAHGFQRLRYWSRGVDTALFSPARRQAPAPARLGGEPGEARLLFVGRLAREKRIELLAPLLRTLDGVHLTIVGDGPASGELKNTFAGLPVTFTGYLRGLELATAYASADLFVFPSDSEAFGNVVLEAMASGLPVVAAAAGGVLDLVEHEQTGLLFEPNDAVQLTRQVNRYLRNPALRREHSNASLAVARARTWEHQQRLLLDHYASALEAAGPRVA
jgi:phosphatidylinositol alpha 1,6-mannosyltransferase